MQHLEMRNRRKGRTRKTRVGKPRRKTNGRRVQRDGVCISERGLRNYGKQRRAFVRPIICQWRNDPPPPWSSPNLRTFCFFLLLLAIAKQDDIICNPYYQRYYTASNRYDTVSGRSAEMPERRCALVGVNIYPYLNIHRPLHKVRAGIVAGLCAPSKRPGMQS